MVSSFPPTQGHVGSNFIVAKVVTSNGGTRGQGQKGNKFKAFRLAQFESNFFVFFFLLCFQKLYHYIQVSIMKIKQKSDLTNNYRVFFSHFW
jgi:hypothetical protein